MNNISKATVIAAVAIMVAVFAVPMMSGDTDAATDTWDGTTDTNWYDETSEETSYEITTAEQLAGLAELVNNGKTFDGITITLGTDLDLSGHAWVPIGFSGRVNPEESLSSIMRFEGTFDGKEHTITGLTSSGYVVGDGDSCIVKNAYTYGLFGFVIDATVSNIILADVSIDLGSAGEITCDTAGAAVGYALGTTSLSNIKVSGSVIATDAVGGVIGRFYGDQITITGCQSTTDVKSTETDGGKAGGIIGILGLKNSSSISACTISGEISAIHAGGMIGLANSTSGTHTFSDITVSNSTITGNLYSGGVVGRGAIGVSISECTVINSKISAIGDSLEEYNPEISYNAGGLMGGQGGEDTSITIKNGTVSSCVVTSIQYSGGFIGSTLGHSVSISGGSVADTEISAVNKSEWDNLTTAAGVVGSISSGQENTQTILLENVSLGSDITLESSNSDYFANSTFYGPMEGAAVSFLGGHGTFEIKEMSDFGNYELIAQASFYSKGSDDEGITEYSTITISDCNTQNMMEWSVQGYRYKVFVEDGSALEGFRSNTQTIMLSMDGTSSINQLIAGADEELAQTMEEKYFIDDKEYENTYVTGQFMVMSGQTVTVDSVTIMEPHTQKENAEGKMIRQYLGKIVGEDETSSLAILTGNEDLSAGTYQWNPVTSKWVSALVTVVAADGTATSYTTLRAAINAAGNKSTITLLDDVTEAVTIPSGKVITIDLNGHTIQNSVDTQNDKVDDSLRNHTVTNNGTLTIQDSVGTGLIDNRSHGRATVYNTGNLTINSGNFTRSAEVINTDTQPNVNSWYLIENRGTATINGGKFSTSSEDGQLGNISSLIRNGDASVSATMTINDGSFTNAAVVLKNEKNSTMTVNGGTFTLDNSETKWAGGNSVLFADGSTTVNGGNFSTVGDGTGILAADSNMNRYVIVATANNTSTKVTGGTFEATDDNTYMMYTLVANTLSIEGGSYTISDNAQMIKENTSADIKPSVSGGQFNTQIDQKYLASDFELKSDGGMWVPSYSGENYEATVGDIQYQTVEAALDNANGGTVTLVAEKASIDANYTFHGSATLDLDGKTLALGDGVQLTVSGDLTINGGGTVSFEWKRPIMINGGSLTLENCTVANDESTQFAEIPAYIWIRGNESDVAGYSILDVSSDVTFLYQGTQSVEAYGVCIGHVDYDDDNLDKYVAYGVEVDFRGTFSGNFNSLFYINGNVTPTTGNVPEIHIEMDDDTEVKGMFYAAGYGEWTIDGGNFTYTEMLSIKSGTFVINGGTFHATGEFKDPAESNNNGSENTGAAVSITTNDAYPQKTSVTINEGTFISDKGYALYEGISMKDGAAAAEKSAAAISVNNGIFTGGTDGTEQRAAVNITEATEKDVISGGSFNTDVSEFAAEGYAVVPNEDGTYGTIKSDTPTGIIIDSDGDSVNVETDGISITIPAAPGPTYSDVTVTVGFPKGEVTVTGTVSRDVTVAFMELADLQGNDFAFNLILTGITSSEAGSVTITIPVGLDAYQRIESVTAYSVVNGKVQEENATVSGSSVIITTNHNTPFYVDWVLGTIPSQGGESDDPFVDDDDDSPLPPIIGPGGSGSSSSSGDDNTVTIVACAAAAVVAALMAVFLIVLYRKD